MPCSSIMALLEVEIRSFCYPHQTEAALRDIYLSVREGELIILTGESLSGKSTLCRCLAGAIPLFTGGRLDGDIRFEGQSILDMRLPELAGKIGLVREEPHNQLFCRILEEDLAFGPCNLLIPPREVKRRIETALDRVGLRGFEQRRPETLSGGESQRAVLASFLTLEPTVLILDRATDQMDLSGRRAIYERLKALCRERRQAVVLVDDKALDFALETDRVLVMEQGTIAFDGQVAELLSHVGRRKTSCFSLPSARHGSLFHFRRSAETDGPGIQPEVPPIGSSDGIETAVIAVKDLCFAYPAAGRDRGDNDTGLVLRDISLEIRAGEYVLLTGENGAGKTTLVKHFNGLLRPQTGRILVNGLDVQNLTPAKLSAHVGYLSQNPYVQICTGSVREEVGFGLKARGLPRREIQERVSHWLDVLGLSAVSELHPYRLARSDVQKVALASCMVLETEILIVDEPTSRMSYPQDWETLELLARFNERGCTLVVISHDVDSAQQFASRVLVMKQGRIVRDLSRVIRVCDQRGTR